MKRCADCAACCSRNLDAHGCCDAANMLIFEACRYSRAAAYRAARGGALAAFSSKPGTDDQPGLLVFEIHFAHKKS